MSASRVSLDRPWLAFDLGRNMRVLSWAMNRPGFVEARRIIWREVRDADLSKDFDVQTWLTKELEQRDEVESVAFLTSRPLDRFQATTAEVGNVSADTVATVGLSNAERVGLRKQTNEKTYGTVNIAAKVDVCLSETGLLEALSIAVQARTVAILDAAIPMASGVATGTGTDCIAIASPVGRTDYAGLHTEVGEALGRAVYDVVYTGAIEWKAERKAFPDT